MWLLRSIWNDILWLNSRLPPLVRIAVLTFGIALIAGAWYLGADWWTTPVIFVVKGMARESPPFEIVGVHVAIILIVYVSYVIGRDRKSR